MPSKTAETAKPKSETKPSTLRLNLRKIDGTVEPMSMEYDGYVRVLKSFGLDETAVEYDDSGAVVLPQVVQDFAKGVKDSFWSGHGFRNVGNVVQCAGLSDPSLNGIDVTIVKVLGERVVIDLKQGPGLSGVRQVSVPAEKVAKVTTRAPPGGEMLATCMCAGNFRDCFEKNGVDPYAAVCLVNRAHPAVSLGQAFSDVPALCDALNACGGRFEVVVGSLVFGDPVSLKSSPLQAVFSEEPHVVLRRPDGALLDVAPDIGGTDFGRGSQEQTRKLFFPYDGVDYKLWRAGLIAIRTYSELGWLATAADMASLDGDVCVADVPTRLGMLPPDLNASVMDVKAVAVITLVQQEASDSEHLQLLGRLAETRREAVQRGNVVLSLELFRAIAEKHAGDEKAGVSMMCRDVLGTICFNCHTRLTCSQSLTCNGCGKAHYCGKSCQRLHWKQHRACCASKEERDRRRAQLAKAVAEAAERKAKHDAREALEAAEAAEKEAARKARAARERAARMAAEADRRFVPALPKKPNCKTQRAATRGTEEQLVHQAWASEPERRARSEAFEAAQAAAHAAKIARQAKEKADGLRQLAKDAEAAREAATHVVPPPAKMSDFL